MSTNALSAAEAQAAAGKAPPAPSIPKGYTKWFDVEFKDIIFDPSILHRKAAIEGYYIGIVTGYNTLRSSKRYSILFEWTEVSSKLANCKDFTLHVYINPPPTVIRKARTTTVSALAAADSGMSSPQEEDEIDPPRPPKPPPPTM